jgi:hypothetical protein
MVNFWILFAIGGILWMVLSFLWEHRYKETKWELDEAEEKIEQLEHDNIELKSALIVARIEKG